jgi:hypothetical protein
VSDRRPAAHAAWLRTGSVFRRRRQSYGYTGSLHEAEYDHLISLQLGGDPNAICKGTATLAAAQRAIASDWTTAESILGISQSN